MKLNSPTIRKGHSSFTFSVFAHDTRVTLRTRRYIHKTQRTTVCKYDAMGGWVFDFFTFSGETVGPAITEQLHFFVPLSVLLLTMKSIFSSLHTSESKLHDAWIQ